MKDVSIYYKKASTAKTLEKIYTKCDFEKPEWSWYEPKPESLIGTEKKPPLETFTAGIPAIPEGVTFSELMLFGDNKGLTIVPDNVGFKYFYWQEKEGFEEIKCQKLEKEKVYFKTEIQLEQQYGISKSKPPSSLYITRYMQNNNCVAWTITENNNA